MHPSSAVLNDRVLAIYKTVLSTAPEDDTKPSLEASDTSSPTNAGYLTCEFCFLSSQESDTNIHKLSPCSHTFCRDCLCTLVEANEGKTQIQCIAQDCPAFLLYAEVKELASADFNKYLKNKNMTDGSDSWNDGHLLRHECLDKQCSGSFVITVQKTQYICITCHKINCLDCDVSFSKVF